MLGGRAQSRCRCRSGRGTSELGPPAEATAAGRRAGSEPPPRAAHEARGCHTAQRAGHPERHLHRIVRGVRPRQRAGALASACAPERSGALPLRCSLRCTVELGASLRKRSPTSGTCRVSSGRCCGARTARPAGAGPSTRPSTCTAARYADDASRRSVVASSCHWCIRAPAAHRTAAVRVRSPMRWSATATARSRASRRRASRRRCQREPSRTRAADAHLRRRAAC